MIVGALSLSVIVPTPSVSAIVALVAPLSVTLSVSPGRPSNSVSLVIGTVIVYVVVPGLKVSVPLVAV